MNIIEAVQKAEQGHCITNHIMMMVGTFYEYSGDGKFHLFKWKECGKKEYLAEKTTFTLAELLCVSWEHG